MAPHPAPNSPDPDDQPLGRHVRLAPGVEVHTGVLDWAFSRASGPGGQNVNKVSTRAELRVRLADLPLSDRVRARLAEQAGRKLIDDGFIVIVAQEHRSQSMNKEECLERLSAMILQAMIEPKVRRATKPSRGSKMRRLEAKKVRGNIKCGRRSGGEE